MFNPYDNPEARFCKENLLQSNKKGKPWSRGNLNWNSCFFLWRPKRTEPKLLNSERLNNLPRTAQLTGGRAVFYLCLKQSPSSFTALCGSLSHPGGHVQQEVRTGALLQEARLQIPTLPHPDLLPWGHDLPVWIWGSSSGLLHCSLKAYKDHHVFKGFLWESNGGTSTQCLGQHLARSVNQCATSYLLWPGNWGQTRGLGILTS